ncbi:hypothetical protein Scep_024046 [Stephania cephalantha]|uniref:non-specific serine/threonine protein kinase n=1 Tax=Stephania cephalantha TaxID=152367 RepID=A0AAP0EWX6_9MAGN
MKFWCTDGLRLGLLVVLLGLSMVIHLPNIFVTGEATWSRVCGADNITFLSSLDRELFYVNGDLVDKASFCKALKYCGLKGCASNSNYEELKRFGENYCGLELTTGVVNLPQRTARKFMLASENSHRLIQVGQSTEENHNVHSLPSGKIVAMAVPGMLLCCALLCPCVRSRRKENARTVAAKEISSMDSIPSLEVNSTFEKVLGSPVRLLGSPLRVPPSPSRFAMSPRISRLGSVHLSMSQVVKATNNFAPSARVGEGGFGTVYKAQLQDGQIVAMKRAKKEHFNSLQSEFSSEVELLSKIEHRNLVKLLGFVDKGSERIIITEFVPNGTLREHLDGQHGKVLDFSQRLEITIDIAHGLTYLHLYAERPIIHRDVKSSNILLTESCRAKVADFGFARIGPTDTEQTHISTKVKGTAGYLDPEYLRTYQLTTKSDVYSFGILMIEILTGRRPVELKRSAHERVTVRWAFKNYNEGNIKGLLDPSMNESIGEEILSKMFSLAFQCAAPTRSDRPNMKEVGEHLWGIRMDYRRSGRRQ